jgi:ABC-2 type transport system ATP-binding protein
MIHATQLTKHYGDKVAVDGLSFAVHPGVVTGFLGPNGAGKSTTMRLILGLDAPTSGRVTVNGRPYAELASPLRAVGALLDPKALDPRRSAVNHLRWLARSNGIAHGRVDEVLGLVGLSDVADKRVGGFSLGMSQRLGLAAALLGDPETLLFDEPVNGLDPEGTLWLRQLLRSLADQGRTVFLSSHLMSEMAQTADHVIVIGRGQLIADSSMADMLHTHAQARVRVRAASRQTELAAAIRDHGGQIRDDPDGSLLVSGVAPSSIGEISVRVGIALEQLTPDGGSLEEAFIELTQHDTDFRSSLVSPTGA